jgi:exonuclease SbcD
MTEPIRILHFSDVHIGMESFGRTDPQTGLSSRVVDFLRRMDDMVNYACEHDVDLTIFAGDAFKSRNPTPTFQREFAYRVQDLASRCPVVLLVGNHDLPSIERRASSIEIYETLQVPNVIVGREYELHEITTKRGPVVVATAPTHAPPRAASIRRTAAPSPKWTPCWKACRAAGGLADVPAGTMCAHPDRTFGGRGGVGERA